MDNRANVAPKPTTKAAAVKESKEAKFRRLGVARTNQAVKRLKQLANLANRANYHYTEEQIAKILAAVREAVKRLEAAFSGKLDGEQGFSL